MQKHDSKPAQSPSAAKRPRVPLVASVLAGGAVAAALAAAAGVAWNIYSSAHTSREHREREIRTAASYLAKAIEREVVRGETGELGYVLFDGAAAYDLDSCTIRVPGGPEIATSTTRETLLNELPARWTGRADTREVMSGDVLTLTVPVRVPSHGELALEVSANTIVKPSDPMMAYMGGIGALVCGLLAVEVMRRTLGVRMKTLALVGQALGKAADGVADPGVLSVADELGPVATSWNSIVAERDALRRFAAFKDAAEHSRRGGGGADLAAAYDAMPQGLVLIDAELKVQFANGAAARLLACRREDLVGSDLRKRIPDSDVIAALESAANSKTRQRVSIESRRVGPTAKEADQPAPESGPGSILRFTARPVRRSDAASVMVVIEDVTQQKIAEDARNSFVAQATHELRTPLTNIRLYVDSMLENSDDAEIRAKGLNVISSESRRLARIVDDMLSMSEIEAGTIKIVKGDVRLDQLFDELKEDYQALAADKEVKFQFELPPKLPVIQGDRDKLALALHNLVGNAVKYTPAGGSVTVKAIDTGTQFLVHVVDSGIGIRKEEQEMVFEKFYRAKDKRVTSITGTGLGLTLARDIARMHGGDIVLESELDKGSTFTLELPLNPAQSSRAAA